jgi:nucleoside phosphorylase
MPLSIQGEHSILVPGSQAGKRIFPFLAVTSALCSGDELTDCYHARVHLMTCLVENHSALSNSADLITYSLLMAGTTPENAIPSIVITASSSIIKDLGLLFDCSRGVNHTQCKRTGGLCEVFASHTQRQDISRFSLVYYATDRPPIMRTAGERTCTAYYRTKSTMCGALLEYETRISTLGLVLQVNSEMRGLTVDHLFNPAPRPRRTRPPGESQESSRRLANADSANNGEASFVSQPWNNNNDAIDFPEGVHGAEDQNASSRLPNQIGNDKIGAQLFVRHAQTVETLEDLPQPEPYLDWALVKFVPHSSFPGCVNLFWPYGPSRNPMLLQRIAEKPRHSKVPVFIVSGQSGVTSGLMLGNVSYIGSNTGQEACKVWIVIPESSNGKHTRGTLWPTAHTSLGISKGDSGSIVVDKETFHVYGHIMGTNPLSYACVVPLVDTIRQVRHCFRAAEVTLPSGNAALYDTRDIGVDRQFLVMSPTPINPIDRKEKRPAHLATDSTPMNLSHRPTEVHFFQEHSGQDENANAVQQLEFRRLGVREYTIGWLCALPEELAAAQILLDKKHEPLAHDPCDETQYTVGSIGNHNVVMGCLSAGQIGVSSAAMVATKMRYKFPNIRFGLMVGIGGGVPNDKDVRLGDIVVSQPYGGHGGVIQYDFGKSEPGGFVHTGFLNTPPHALLQALANLQARHFLEDNNIPKYVSVVERRARFRRPDPNSDVLFQDTYDHVEGEKTCERCDKSRTVLRRPREHNNIVIHYGTIASGNRVIKNSKERNSLNSQFKGVLCFEMEAAGLMNTWPCLVIRGISDYADSHKNDDWKLYAAGVAAAFAKELLLCIAPAAVENEQSIGEVAAAGSPTSPHDISRRTSFRSATGIAEPDVQGRVQGKGCPL